MGVRFLNINLNKRTVYNNKIIRPRTLFLVKVRLNTFTVYKENQIGANPFSCITSIYYFLEVAHILIFPIFPVIYENVND